MIGSELEIAIFPAISPIDYTFRLVAVSNRVALDSGQALSTQMGRVDVESIGGCARAVGLQHHCRRYVDAMVHYCGNNYPFSGQATIIERSELYIRMARSAAIPSHISWCFSPRSNLGSGPVLMANDTKLQGSMA